MPPDRGDGPEEKKYVAKDASIIFVYNADSGILSTAKDYVQKIVAPETYECNLCGLTYGNMGMKREWKGLISGLDTPVEFLHKDEFLKLYPQINAKYPAAFVKRGSDLDLFITAEEINECRTLDGLMDLVRRKATGIKNI
ncbi:MAG TPA: hypothetical protein HA349_10640 [Methanotrichaceae archaeon]|nr:hypothetical protein [Methanotrichaceae archaeon]